MRSKLSLSTVFKLALFAVVILGIVTAIGVYYFWSNNKTATIAVVSAPQVNTSGWKTFQNTDRTYSIKYPPTWSIEDLTSGTRFYSKPVGSIQKGTYTLPEVIFEYYRNSNLLPENTTTDQKISSLPDYLNRSSKSGLPFNYSKVQINNLIGYQSLVYSSFDGSSAVVYWIESNSHYFSITFSGSSLTENDKAVLLSFREIY